MALTPALSYLRAWLQLVRWPNVLITALTLAALYYAVWLPAGIVPCSTVQLWYIIGIGGTALAAGNVVNDLFDRRIDTINKPDKVIVGRLVSVRTAKAGYAVLLLSGAVFAVLLARSSGQWWWPSLWAFVSVNLWLYSARMKCTPLLGNVAVACMCAGVPFMLWLHGWGQHRWLHATPNLPTSLTAWYMYFAWVSTLLREVVKDCEDTEGDRANGCRTVPIAWGLSVARRLSGSMVLLLLAGELWLLMRYTETVPLAIFVSAALIVPTLYIGYRLPRACTARHFGHLSDVVKLLMVAGLAVLLLPG